MTIAELKLLKESEDRVEFKSATHNYSYNGGSHSDQNERRKCFLGYVIALANEGGGKLILGMTDKLPHDVVGTDFGLGKIGALEDQTYAHLSIRIRIEELYENKKRVIVVNIPSRPIGRMMKYEGVPLMRTGDSLRNMSDEEMFSILMENEPDFSAKNCEGLSISDLDEEAIEIMKNAYAEKQKNPAFRTLSANQVLNDLHLSVDETLTYAALILLAKKDIIVQKLPQAKIIWEYRYTESQIHNDSREEICAPLFIGIDKIWKLVNDRNGNTPIRSDAYIFSINTFNEDVIREAILNAIAHRDYTIASEIVIKQYPKKIIINNPGGFPKGVTIDNLLTISSTPRSRLMTEVLEKTGLVERSGQGIDKIFSITLSEGKPEPNYKDSDLYQVTLKLDGSLEDKAFHIFIGQIQSEHGDEQKLGVEQIIGLYNIKQGHFNKVKPEILIPLDKEGLIKRSGGSTTTARYTLSDAYSKLASKAQRIGNKYVVAEIEIFLQALQGQVLAIGDLEKALTGSLNRNQIKYLLQKLFDDEVVISEGTGRGTKYKLTSNYSLLKGDVLINEVLDILRRKHEGGS